MHDIEFYFYNGDLLLQKELITKRFNVETQLMPIIYC